MAGDSFFTSSGSAAWKKVLDIYQTVLEKKARTKTKPQAGKELIELDKWFQKDLSQLLQSRPDRHITLEELQKLVRWKITRGKFRPTLPSLVASNKPEDVISTSSKAFAQLPNLKSAIETLSKLRGIGPATASAVLAAGAPEHVPFMSDESVLSVPGMTSIKYDLNCYLQYAKALQSCVQRLQEEDAEFGWNPHKVELTLWTYTMAKQLDSSLLDGLINSNKRDLSNGDGATESKRKRGKKN